MHATAEYSFSFWCFVFYCKINFLKVTTMLKCPFSEKSVKSGEYTEKEKQLLESGTLTKLDVEITKFLYENNKNANAEFLKSIENDSLITLLIRGNEDEFIGKDGSIVNTLSKELKRKIRIVPLPDKIERTIASIYNIKITKIVEIYSPKEEPVKKIYVKKHELSQEKIDELTKLFTYLYKMKTELVFTPIQSPEPTTNQPKS